MVKRYNTFRPYYPCRRPVYRPLFRSCPVWELSPQGVWVTRVQRSPPLVGEDPSLWCPPRVGGCCGEGSLRKCDYGNPCRAHCYNTATCVRSIHFTFPLPYILR